MAQTKKRVEILTPNSEIVYKYLTCYKCGAREVKVEENVVKVVCHICCANYGDPTSEEKHNNEGFPKGWKFFKQFVHVDGRVFEKGVENLSLKGKLEPTTITPAKKLTKKDKQVKKELKEKKALERYEKKKKFLKDEEVKKVKEKKRIEHQERIRQFFE